jgi:cellulose synthase/poly-beta-1,6-N-acetylglucosamine synthase-like glycosyltransferase
MGWNRLGGNLVVSGALGLFDRELVIAAGGYKPGTLGEDMELIVRLHRFYRANRIPKTIRFIADPLAWTEVPATAKSLGSQRERWYRGLIESLWLHRVLFFNPRYGIIGLLNYPFFVLGELVAPIIEGLGIIGLILGYLLGAIDSEFIVMFFLAAWGVNILMNLAAILVEQLTYKRYSGLDDLGRMIYYALIENVGYRQVTVWWRLKAYWSVVTGKRSWGFLGRQGFR